MSYCLRQIYAERYGAFSKRELGPLRPGLNVVFGRNESGKTTMASLIGGVLFGWEDAHGVLNTYKPAEGERSGMLAFAEDAAEDEPMKRLVRAGDGCELQGDFSLVSDIDANTYKTIFSLTSEELLSLRTTSDVTARLLAAGSGTAYSPSSVFVELEQRIAARTSPAQDAEDSVLHMAQQLDSMRADIQRSTQEVELLKQKDRELLELRKSRAEAADRIGALNSGIEELVSLRARLDAVDAGLRGQERILEELRGEYAEVASQARPPQGVDGRLMELDSVAERSLRDKIEELSEAQQKARRIVDTAKENSAASTAAYEALLELDDEGSVSRMQAIKSKTSHAVVSIVPMMAFIVAGVALFIYGRHLPSLSFTAFGVALIVLAFFLAIATVVGFMRPGRSSEEVDKRRQDAQWVMLQDKKKYDSSQAELDGLQREIAEFLDGAGLSQAEGSLRQARVVLDEARDLRAAAAAANQKLASLDMRISAAEQELQRLEDERRSIEEVLAGPLGEEMVSVGRVSLQAVDEAVKVKTAQRAALLEVSEDASGRIGELSRELEQARNDTSLDELKLEYEQRRTRLRDAKHELIVLVLAKRMLERSMASWESRNQPEVYEEAGRLLGLITDGRWTQVSMSSTGSILAVNAKGEAVKPRHLSLGTCQQLYLALRVALLLTAQQVGRSVPVVADDIMVHFDAERRRGAARVLAELASDRQVILFTCHEETVEALREAVPDLNYLQL